MFLKRTGNLLKRMGFFMPFTWYFVLFSLIVYLGLRYLRIRSALPESAYRDIFILLLKVVLVFSLALLLFGFITVLVSFIFLKFKQKQKYFVISVSTDEKGSDATVRKVQVEISPILKPLMGFVKLRINYDGEKFSNKFSLVSFSSKKIFETSIKGVYEWDLPEIREYRIEQVLLYFEDMFQFFSLATSLNITNSFYTAAFHEEINQFKASPRKTEETTTRIEELKKVEGEHLNYKNFESNDDVRRIVWKIYAKNKELVVRIPEIVDPYASHVYLCTSFFAGLNIQLSEIVNIPLLNFYKRMCWSVYKQLKANGLEVRFRSDAEVPVINSDSEEERIRYAISIAGWHKNRSLKEFIRLREDSVVVVSSLSNFEEVRDILERGGNDLTVIFIPLSEAFERNGAFSWLKWLFIQEEKNAEAVFRSKWNISLQRPAILQNEKVLGKLIKEYQRSVILYTKD